MLIFVYNSNAGLVNRVWDLTLRVLIPSTNKCNLYQLTHGVFFECELWKEFKKCVGLKIELLYKDEFEKKYDRKCVYPIVLEFYNGEYRTIIPKTEIDRMRTVETLTDFVLSEKGSLR